MLNFNYPRQGLPYYAWPPVAHFLIDCEGVLGSPVRARQGTRAFLE
jgi:hypothetical protein